MVYRKIARDKWRHFFVGILMGIFLQVAGLWLIPRHPYFATTLAFLVVIAISYGFELFSKFTGRGIYDVADAVASIIGGITGMVVAIAGLYVIA